MNHEGHGNSTAEKAAQRAGDISDVKRFLYTIRNEQGEINELQERIEELTTALLPAAIRYDRDKVQVSPSDQISEKMAEIADYTLQLEKKLRRLTIRRIQAQKMIDQLQNSQERQVLDLYFLSSKRLKMREVAERMEYSEQQTYEYYKRGLQRLKSLVNQSKNQ